MYTNATALSTLRQLQLLLCKNEYMFQFLSHDDVEHVNATFN
jgi:hypothetical protein